MKKRIRIGVVTTHPIQYQVPLFREMSSREGVEVDVFYNYIPDATQQGRGFGTSFEWDLPLLNGYNWKVLDGKGIEASQARDSNTFGSLAEAYRASDVMLIHGWQSLYMQQAWVYGLFSTIPLMVRGESNALRRRPWYVHLLHRMYLWPYAKYLYIGESSRTFYLNAGISASDLYFAPYCVENARFDEDWQRLRDDRSELRTELEIDPSATCFLFCGKFSSKKRPSDVLTGFLEASGHSDRPLHLIMVGDGELRQEVEAQTPNDAPVTYTGFLNQTEIGKTYAMSDVLVLPSDYGETWGLVINEGMIFENPAIVSDRVGSHPDLIEDGKTGYVFPFGDTESLASKMLQAVHDPDNLQEMGRAAREIILSKYSIDKAVDGIVRAAKDALTSQR